MLACTMIFTNETCDIWETPGALRFRSRRQFGAAFMNGVAIFFALQCLMAMFGLAVVTIVKGMPPPGAIFTAVAGLAGGAFAWFAWRVGGGRFGEFAIHAGGAFENLSGKAPRLHPKGAVVYAVMRDWADGMQMRPRYWLTARTRERLGVYRLGKMSEAEGAQLLQYIETLRHQSAPKP